MCHMKKRMTDIHTYIHTNGMAQLTFVARLDTLCISCHMKYSQICYISLNKYNFDNSISMIIKLFPVYKSRQTI